MENKSKKNCKNLGTDRTWHEPPLSKALAWRFTEVCPSTTCASCGACTLAVPNPLVFIKLPNAVGNFNPKAAEELPSIHKKEAARRIIALPSRWQSMCMINIQHTKFETHGGQDQENPSVMPKNVSSVHMTLECSNTKVLPLSGCITMCLPWKVEPTKSYHDDHNTREKPHATRIILLGTLVVVLAEAFLSVTLDCRIHMLNTPGGPPTPMAADVARRWRGRWQREEIHPHRTPERAAYSAITNSSFSFTFPQASSVKFAGFLFAQRQMGRGQVGIESERNKVGK